jgi:hypothetical protein
MKRARRLTAVGVIAFAFFGLVSCAGTTAIGVTTIHDADRADKQPR